jgi:hypothetical protein
MRAGFGVEIQLGFPQRRLEVLAAFSFSALQRLPLFDSSKLSSFPIGEAMCSLSEDQSFQKNIMDRMVASPPAK